MVTVQWPKWSSIINKAFLPLVNNRDRILILYGGRGSTKSSFAVRKLIFRCLSEKYFRYILSRANYNDIKDSMYQDIVDTILQMGLGDLFQFKVQPMEIICIENGNKFIARGRDNAKKLKSVKDPTGVWYEEDIPTEEEFITISSGVRTSKADYLQEIFTINPEVEGNFQDNWFWKRFFSHKLGEKSYSDKTIIKVPKVDKEGRTYTKDVEIGYTVHHSTWRDNRWATDIFIAQMLELKANNAYYYTVYDLGEWGNKQLGGRFYKKFDPAKNSFNFKYNSQIPLHISFDFNNNPYMTCSVWQVEGKGAYLIDELAMVDPYNKIKDTCEEFIRRYNFHEGGLFIYGDPSGKKEDVNKEKGHNYFLTIQSNLRKFRPTMRIAKSQPPVVPRGEFIDDIFSINYGGLSIFLFEKSIYLKNDLLFGKQAPGGEKLKEREKVNGIPGVEKYHHFSDSMDYFICEIWRNEFIAHQRGPLNSDAKVNKLIPNISANRNRL